MYGSASVMGNCIRKSGNVILGGPPPLDNEPELKVGALQPRTLLPRNPFLTVSTCCSFNVGIKSLSCHNIDRNKEILMPLVSEGHLVTYVLTFSDQSILRVPLRGWWASSRLHHLAQSR